MTFMLEGRRLKESEETEGQRASLTTSGLFVRLLNASCLHGILLRRLVPADTLPGNGKKTGYDWEPWDSDGEEGAAEALESWKGSRHSMGPKRVGPSGCEFWLEETFLKFHFLCVFSNPFWNISGYN